MIPSDPMILYSFVNMKLRDEYPNLESLCEDLNIDEQNLRDKLLSVGFEYNLENNKFW